VDGGHAMAAVLTLTLPLQMGGEEVVGRRGCAMKWRSTRPISKFERRITARVWGDDIAHCESAATQGFTAP
jgi:hypothetical protein